MADGRWQMEAGEADQIVVMMLDAGSSRRRCRGMKKSRPELPVGSFR
jgi:hypothetical protein